MAKSSEESKSDGLKILSVGTLYTGPWDKKYWSSSRGKDRYPYPVGYQALRTHKGSTERKFLKAQKGLCSRLLPITNNPVLEILQTEHGKIFRRSIVLVLSFAWQEIFWQS